MKRSLTMTLLAGTFLAAPAWAGQVPGAASDPDVPVNHHDRVYVAPRHTCIREGAIYRLTQEAGQ